MRALVVFSDDRCPEGLLQRCLKPGFRHVFVVLDDGQGWIRVDGKAGVPEVAYTARSDFDLATFYRLRGLRVIATKQDVVPARAPFALANCVGLVKAFLCLRAPFAWTPYRLHRHLQNRRKRNR